MKSLVIGDRLGDRLTNNLSPSETIMNKQFFNTGNRGKHIYCLVKTLKTTCQS